MRSNPRRTLDADELVARFAGTHGRVRAERGRLLALVTLAKLGYERAIRDEERVTRKLEEAHRRVDFTRDVFLELRAMLRERLPTPETMRDRRQSFHAARIAADEARVELARAVLAGAEAIAAVHRWAALCDEVAVMFTRCEWPRKQW